MCAQDHTAISGGARTRTLAATPRARVLPKLVTDGGPDWPFLGVPICEDMWGQSHRKLTAGVGRMSGGNQRQQTHAWWGRSPAGWFLPFPPWPRVGTEVASSLPHARFPYRGAPLTLPRAPEVSLAGRAGKAHTGDEAQSGISLGIQRGAGIDRLTSLGGSQQPGPGRNRPELGQSSSKPRRAPCGGSARWRRGAAGGRTRAGRRGARTRVPHARGNAPGLTQVFRGVEPSSGPAGRTGGQDNADGCSCLLAPHPVAATHGC